MRIPTTVNLFKFIPYSAETPNRSMGADQMLQLYESGQIQPTKTYKIVTNNAPNKIRKSTLHDIYKTETSVVDINEVSVTPYDSTTEDQVVSKLRYTDYNDDKQLENFAYYKMKDGHSEIVLFIPGAYLVNDVNNPRITFMTVDDQDGNVIVSTAMIEEDTIMSTFMKSASNKVVRILINKAYNENGYSIRLYHNIFKYIDLGILEVSTMFDRNLNALINSVKSIETIDNNTIRVKSNITNNGSKICSKYQTVDCKL